MLAIHEFSSLSDISVDIFSCPSEFQLVVFERGVKFEFQVNCKSLASSLIVFGQSALGNRDLELPVFHRGSWANDFERSSTVALNDPTLYLSDELLGGWFQGTRDHFYMTTCAEIVQKIAQLMGLSNDKVVFYGSSAGGFSSLMMACDVPGSHVVAEVPQIDMNQYHVKSALANICKYSYQVDEIEQVNLTYPSRINVISRMMEIPQIPNIYFIQNIADNLHIDRHLMPFMNYLNKRFRGGSEFSSKVMVAWFFKVTPSGDGHLPADRNFSVGVVKDAIAKFT